MATWEQDAAVAQQLHQAGDYAKAETSIQRIIQREPAQPALWFMLGMAQQSQGKTPGAVESYRHTTRLDPKHADAWTNLGICLARLRQLPEAVTALHQAVQTSPGHAKAHNNLGVALAELGRGDEALACWREAVRLEPGYAEGHFNLAVALADRGKGDEAIAGYKRALALKPDYAEAYNNLGWTLKDLGRPGEAVAHLRQAVLLRPEYVEAHNNLGLALAELGRFDDAVHCYDRALGLRPGDADVHANLAAALAVMDRPDEALACYEQAMWLKPDQAEIRWNRSLMLLQLGRYEEGWREYEWRWKRKNAVHPRFEQPMWDGSPLVGKTILLWSEQGLGDIIQFCRYANVVKRMGGTVILQILPPLVPLLSTCQGADRVIAEGETLPDFDVQAPFLGLPRLCGTTLETIPADIPYLTPDENLVAAWRERIGQEPGFKIGIAWQGNPKHRWDRHRSFPLRLFEPISRTANVRLYSLQKGPGCEQLKANTAFPVVEFDDLDAAGGFRDTAALMNSLDLVITCDSVLVHLAGALGVDCFVALAKQSDWRWLREADTTPWYPSARLFRQRMLGDWKSAFAAMTELVQHLACGDRNGMLIHAPVSPGELIDKISILEIKRARIADPEKLANVTRELAALQGLCDKHLRIDAALAKVVAELRTINEELWDVEEGLRFLEKRNDFGPDFIIQARAVYQLNDQRSSLKRRINESCKSPIVEEKSF
jgi:tetratricopeptide (TPR) repeat protein